MDDFHKKMHEGKGHLVCLCRHCRRTNRNMKPAWRRHTRRLLRAELRQRKTEMTAMTAHELANILDGREYRKEMTKEEEALAKEAGLFVLFGYSDDCVEVRGAYSEEISAWEGTTILFDPVNKCLLINHCPSGDDCPHWSPYAERAVEVEALWCQEPPYSWTFQTAIPHATFDVIEDGEKFCRGIVFHADAIENEG